MPETKLDSNPTEALNTSSEVSEINNKKAPDILETTSNNSQSNIMETVKENPEPEIIELLDEDSLSEIIESTSKTSQSNVMMADKKSPELELIEIMDSSFETIETNDNSVNDIEKDEDKGEDCCETIEVNSELEDSKGEGNKEKADEKDSNGNRDDDKEFNHEKEGSDNHSSDEEDSDNESNGNEDSDKHDSGEGTDHEDNEEVESDRSDSDNDNDFGHEGNDGVDDDEDELGSSSYDSEYTDVSESTDEEDKIRNYILYYGGTCDSPSSVVNSKEDSDEDDDVKGFNAKKLNHDGSSERVSYVRDEFSKNSHDGKDNVKEKFSKEGNKEVNNISVCRQEIGRARNNIMEKDNEEVIYEDNRDKNYDAKEVDRNKDNASENRKEHDNEVTRQAVNDVEDNCMEVGREDNVTDNEEDDEQGEFSSEDEDSYEKNSEEEDSYRGSNDEEDSYGGSNEEEDDDREVNRHDDAGSEVNRKVHDTFDVKRKKIIVDQGNVMEGDKEENNDHDGEDGEQEETYEESTGEEDNCEESSEDANEESSEDANEESSEDANEESSEDANEESSREGNKKYIEDVIAVQMINEEEIPEEMVTEEGVPDEMNNGNNEIGREESLTNNEFGTMRIEDVYEDLFASYVECEIKSIAASFSQIKELYTKLLPNKEMRATNFTDILDATLQYLHYTVDQSQLVQELQSNNFVNTKTVALWLHKDPANTSITSLFKEVRPPLHDSTLVKNFLIKFVSKRRTNRFEDNETLDQEYGYETEDMGGNNESTSENESYTCAACRVKRSSLQSFITHLSAETVLLTYWCRICGYITFNNVCTLIYHELIHVADTPGFETCISCSTFPRSLSDHLLPDMDKPIECKFCDGKFYNDCAFCYHSSNHLGGPFFCSVCGELYLYESDLEEHTQFRCYIKCKQIFFYCPVCFMIFSEREMFGNHVFSDHFSRLHSCPMCELLFTRQDSVYEHIREDHPNLSPTYQVHNYCALCPNFNYRSMSQHDHLLYHSIQNECQVIVYKCNNCNLITLSQQKIMEHRKNTCPRKEYLVRPQILKMCTSCFDAKSFNNSSPFKCERCQLATLDNPNPNLAYSCSLCKIFLVFSWDSVLDHFFLCHDKTDLKTVAEYVLLYEKNEDLYSAITIPPYKNIILSCRGEGIRMHDLISDTRAVLDFHLKEGSKVDDKYCSPSEGCGPELKLPLALRGKTFPTGAPSFIKNMVSLKYSTHFPSLPPKTTPSLGKKNENSPIHKILKSVASAKSSEAVTNANLGRRTKEDIEKVFGKGSVRNQGPKIKRKLKASERNLSLPFVSNKIKETKNASKNGPSTSIESKNSGSNNLNTLKDSVCCTEVIDLDDSDSSQTNSENSMEDSYNNAQQGETSKHAVEVSTEPDKSSSDDDSIKNIQASQTLFKKKLDNVLNKQNDNTQISNATDKIIRAVKPSVVIRSTPSTSEGSSDEHIEVSSDEHIEISSDEPSEVEDNELNIDTEKNRIPITNNSINEPQINLKNISENNDSCSSQKHVSEVSQNIFNSQETTSECGLTEFVERNRSEISLESSAAPEVFSCYICSKLFSSQKGRNVHIRAHANAFKVHNLKPFKCPYCVNCFGTEKDVNDHLKIHDLQLDSTKMDTNTGLKTKLQNSSNVSCSEDFTSERKRPMVEEISEETENNKKTRLNDSDRSKDTVVDKLDETSAQSKTNRSFCSICGKDFLNSLLMSVHMQCHGLNLNTSNQSITVTPITKPSVSKSTENNS